MQLIKLLYSTSAYLFTITLYLLPMLAHAAPSGRIANTLFDGPLGKILLGLFIVFFLPLIVLRMLKTRRLSRMAMRNLTLLGRKHRDFEWLHVKQVAQTAFQRIHQAWTSEDLTIAAEYVEESFLQHQQVTYLDDWQQRGLQNICRISKITKTFPILVLPRNDEGITNNQSIVVLYMAANMQDYLQDKASGEIVEGNDKDKEVASIWTFTLIEGKWRVSNIESDGLLEDYLDIAKQQPPLDVQFG
ncbi:Tim44 domain-containing protein [Alteromonas flava]|uniref:Tim44 domain-containing protein n=1 Tax=Alteromonas flava TaxID=2048003 RepID=UPI000C291D90|nr:Tim44-like domain-containing protein [Alteromonas flava]